MIAPRAMLTRGSVVAEVEETPLACIRVLDRECVCVCMHEIWERSVRVCLLCIRVQPRVYQHRGSWRGGIGIPPTDRARQTMDV